MKRVMCVLAIIMMVLNCGCHPEGEQQLTTTAIPTTSTVLATTTTTNATTTTAATTSSTIKTTKTTTTRQKTTTAAKVKTREEKIEDIITSTVHRVHSLLSDEIKEEKGVFTIRQVQGTITHWCHLGDIVYIVFYKPNRFIALDTNTGELLCNQLLEEIPIEVQVVNGDLWISFPNRQGIAVYDTNTFSEKAFISLDAYVMAFEVYESYIFYTSDYYAVTRPSGVWLELYRYNTETGETEQIMHKWNSTSTDLVNFYSPALLVNEADKLLYVGRTGLSRNASYMFNTDTLELEGAYVCDEDMPSMSAKKIFLLDDGVYFSHWRLSRADFHTVLHDYFYYVYRQPGDYAGFWYPGDPTKRAVSSPIWYADKDFIITRKGFFRHSGENLTQDENWSAGEITESGNIFLAKSDILCVLFNR